MPSPKPIPLVLSDAERGSLEALSRKRTASQALAARARVVLACTEEGGVPLTRVMARTGMSRESVRKRRVRLTERRMDGLGDAPRPGAARKITDGQVEVLVMRTPTGEGPQAGQSRVDPPDGRRDGPVAVVGRRCTCDARWSAEPIAKVLRRSAHRSVRVLEADITIEAAPVPALALPGSGPGRIAV